MTGYDTDHGAVVDLVADLARDVFPTRHTGLAPAQAEQTFSAAAQ